MILRCQNFAIRLAILINLWSVFGGLANSQDKPDTEPRVPKVEIPERLVVATRNVPPFAMQNDKGNWEGISIDLLRQVKAELENQAGHPIEIVFKPLPLNEMLDAVSASEVDLAVAALTVNFEREKKMDFTHAFHNSGLGIAVAAKERRSGWSGIMDAILSRTFLLIVLWLFLAMLVSAFAIYLFERKKNPEQFDRNWFKGISAGMWWAAVTITTVGYGDKTPKTLGGRVIGLVWMFAGLFIIAGFTAAVTSALTITQLKSRISGPNDLSRIKVASVEGSTSGSYLKSRHIIYKKFRDVESALASLVADECDAVVYDAPILKYLTYHNHSGEAFVLPITFERQNYAFALPEGSPLREPVNQILLRQTASPEWDDRLKSYFGETNQ